MSAEVILACALTMPGMAEANVASITQYVMMKGTTPEQLTESPAPIVPVNFTDTPQAERGWAVVASSNSTKSVYRIHRIYPANNAGASFAIRTGDAFRTEEPNRYRFEEAASGTCRIASKDALK